MENEIDIIYNNPISFGKFNAILFFKDSSICFQTTCEDVTSLFRPNEINFSSFDLDDLEMKEMEGVISSQNDNLLLKAILTRETEELIIEYYRGQFILEHLFRYSNLQIKEGCSLIRRYLKEKLNSILIIGYELSIDITSFTSSLEENVKDISLYPIIVVKNVNGDFEKERYIYSADKITKQKISAIEDYLKVILE